MHNDFGPFANALGAFAFWGFLAIAVVVSHIVPFLKERETQQTIRHLAERGQDLDPAVVEALLKKTKPDRREELSYLKLGGMVVCAVGLGLAGMGFAVSAQASRPIYPLFGAAGIVFFIGLALLIYALQTLAQKKREETSVR